jgi:geranylgeranyl diphosphate synthase type II
MYSIEELLKKVNEEIDGTYNLREPKNLYEPISYALSVGGKRIRPALCLMACNVFNDNIQAALKPAVGLETFHNFTLLHDDIMDHADVRRNQPTVHKKWDENTAILSGDAMMIEAYEYFFDLSPELMSQCLPVFNQTAREVCEGQQYDMEFENRLDVSEDEYLEMIRLKTAVLLAASLKIGAILGGASGDDSDKIYQFGINMGLAFQLQDDYLDTFGDEKTFGKRIGGDIAENKKTYLLINALKQGNDLLTAMLENKQVDKQEKINVVTQIYRDLEIDKLTEEKIKHYYQEALNSLDAIEVNSDKTILLRNFLNQLKSRVF